MLDLTEAEIAKRLAKALDLEREAISSEYPELQGLFQSPPVPAAILMPLLRNRKAWHLLFIRRTADQQEHSNQVAYPGGRVDPQDLTAEQTALREAYEEIGLNPQDVRILGRLREFLTVTNYHITPVVGIIPWPYALQLDLDEVSRAFTIPLDWLADAQNREIRQRTLPPPFSTIPVTYFQSYDGEVLWGASARITLALLDIFSS